MHSPSGSNNPAADMIVKRLVAAGALLWLGAMLGSCSPIGGYVADRWPHWAGGLPPDAPPRPGAPGYDEFITHGGSAPNTTTPDTGAATGAAPAAGVETTSAQPGKSLSAKNQMGKAQVGRIQQAPAQATARQGAQSEAPPPAAPSDNPSAEDTSVVKGGLY
jgi:hypothetical protein